MISWGMLRTVGVALARAVVGVEALVPAAPGPQKADLATMVVQGVIEACGGVAAPALLADPEVQQAILASITANVTLLNLLARKHQALMASGGQLALPEIHP